MTPDQITLVQESFKSVAPIKETAAELFYGRLFELDPDVRALFKGDMKEQGRKLMTMIATAVNGLTKLDSIVPAVQDLGVRHVGYGVKPEDYDTVAAALERRQHYLLGELLRLILEQVPQPQYDYGSPCTDRISVDSARPRELLVVAREGAGQYGV